MVRIDRRIEPPVLFQIHANGFAAPADPRGGDGRGTDVSREAWKTYDRWLQDERVVFLDEPPEIEPAFRGLTQSKQAAREGLGGFLSCSVRSIGPADPRDLRSRLRKQSQSTGSTLILESFTKARQPVAQASACGFPFRRRAESPQAEDGAT